MLDYGLLCREMRYVCPALLHLWMRTAGHIMGLVNFVYRARTDDPDVLHTLISELRIRVKFIIKVGPFTLHRVAKRRVESA